MVSSIRVIILTRYGDVCMYVQRRSIMVMCVCAQHTSLHVEMRECAYIRLGKHLHTLVIVILHLQSHFDQARAIEKLLAKRKELKQKAGMLVTQMC